MDSIEFCETELDFQIDEVSNFLPMSIKENDLSIFAKFECYRHDCYRQPIRLRSNIMRRGLM